MPSLKTLQNQMIMRFQEMVEAREERSKRLEDQFNIIRMMDDRDDDITSEMFVERVLDAMRELGKASPAIAEFTAQYDSEDGMMKLVEEVDNKLVKVHAEREDLDDYLDEKKQKYQAARDAFEEAGGKCLDVIISNNVLPSFMAKAGSQLAYDFTELYSKVLAENGVFEMAMEKKGLTNDVHVYRKPAATPEIAMTPEVSETVKETLDDLLWEYGQDRFPGDCARHISNSLQDSLVRTNRNPNLFPDSLPLKELYIRGLGESMKNIRGTIDAYRFQQSSRGVESTTGLSR